MNDDRMHNLLRHADPDAGPPPLPPDLPQRIFRAARRRRTLRLTRRATLAAVVLLLAMGALWHTRSRQHAPRTVADSAPSPSASDPAAAPHDHLARIEAELTEIRAEADWRMGLAMKMWQRERDMREKIALRSRLARLEPGRSAREQVEYAAFAMLDQADRISRLLGPTSSAREIYRQLSEDFPDTRSAAIARQRLIESHQQEKGSS